MNPSSAITWTVAERPKDPVDVIISIDPASATMVLAMIDADGHVWIEPLTPINPEDEPA